MRLTTHRVQTPASPSETGGAALTVRSSVALLSVDGRSEWGAGCGTVISALLSFGIPAGRGVDCIDGRTDGGTFGSASGLTATSGATDAVTSGSATNLAAMSGGTDGGTFGSASTLAATSGGIDAVTSGSAANFAAMSGGTDGGTFG